MLQYWALRVAHFQNDSSILLFVAMDLWEKQLWRTENGKERKVRGFLWDEPNQYHSEETGFHAGIPPIARQVQRHPPEGKEMPFLGVLSPNGRAPPSILGAPHWSSFLCLKVHDWEEMMNHPDKMMLSAQIKGSAEESSGNLQCKRSCQCLVQLNSKAETSFTSGCIHTGNPKGGIFWQILDLSYTSA